jgi:RsmE family RNA methyltransferase
MNLILVRSSEVGDEGRWRATDDRAAHMIRVLHVGPGSVVRIGQIDGPLGTATVDRVDAGVVDLRCAFEATPPRRPSIDLLLALPRPKVMRRLWAQLAALGVRRIILTNAERVERNYFDTHVLTRECFQPLLIEGLQQARDTWLPEVSIHRQLKVLVEDDLDRLCGNGVRLLADPDLGSRAQQSDGEGSGLSRISGEGVLLAVGPEGGWNDYERGLLRAHRFESVSIGPRTLRTDTACIALVALLNDRMDGFKAQSLEPRA